MGSVAPNNLLGERITIQSRIVVTKLGLRTTGPGGNGIMALYSDNGGHPNQLVAYTAASTVIAAGVNELPVVLQGPVDAGTYWIMADYDSPTGICSDRNISNNTIDYAALPFGTQLPTTFPTPTTYLGSPHFYYIVGYQ